MANRVILTGRLTTDPELRKTPQDISVTSFTIAIPKKFKREGADFIDIVAWRQKAEFLCQYFSKGKWVEIDGSIQTRTYTDKEGKNRKAVEILADEVNFVGDKNKDEATPTSAPPAPPTGSSSGFDPFAQAALSKPVEEFNENDDLPF